MVIEKQQQELGDLFLEEVEKYLNIVKKNPRLYPIRHDNKRVAVIRRFPFLIAYEQIDKEIYVYAVFNTNQSPRKLKDRGKS